jgi:hypothetical protein
MTGGTLAIGSRNMNGFKFILWIAQMGTHRDGIV